MEAVEDETAGSVNEMTRATEAREKLSSCWGVLCKLTEDSSSNWTDFSR